MAIAGEKGARRFRRKDCDYIIWEVLFDRWDKKECLTFALQEYFKKNRFLKGDRIVVIITAILWVMHKDELDWQEAPKDCMENNIDLNIPFDPDAFVIDKHCSAGRKLGRNLVDFAQEGCLVVDENKQWLHQKYRKAYMDGKMGTLEDIESSLETIRFEDLKNITPCMTRTCGGKVMCFFAIYRGKAICLKEGRRSMNYNRDYIVVDHLKKLFGLNDLGMTRVKMNKVSTKKDKTIDTWDNNTEWLDADGVVYSMMNRVPGARLSWNKERINMHELVKIGLFRSIFRVTDFNLTNVLGDEDGNLWSIDEHQIGVKKNIFGRKCGWVKNITKEIVDEVLKDLMEKGEDKLYAIVEKMTEYKYKKPLIQECMMNYKQLRKRVYTEMGW